MRKATGKAHHPHDSKRPTSKCVLAAIKTLEETGDVEALLGALTVRQRRFAEEYVYDFNATAAVIRAGYSLNHADKQAYLLKHHKGVVAYIDYLSKNKETNITVVDENYIIQKIVKTIDKAEDIVNLTAVLRGLELLARHKGMLTDKQEITGKDGGPIETMRIEQDARHFTELLKQLGDRAKSQEKKEIFI